jgi:hypothetical protein
MMKKLLFYCAISSACLWHQVPALADPITMEMVLQEITQTYSRIIRHQHNSGFPKKELTPDDLHLAGVYEQAEAVLQKWNDRLEAWDKDPLVHISATDRLNGSLMKASEAIYILYIAACAKLHFPEEWSNSED